MNRGPNLLLEACYRDLAKAAFHIDLIVTAIIVGLIALVWSL